ncbi:MAG: hypothetical protein IGS48_07890 [Oscillatoriales cyanobacterium C42_A2020_001]|nr:hypothetical protein [Leptolyngbyaceae cyanobacterium C42_A2020_001]
MLNAVLFLGAQAVSAQDNTPDKPDVARIRELSRPASTLKEWRAQAEAAIAP